MKQELLQYIGDEISLLEVNEIYSLGYEIVFKAGKAYIKYGDIKDE